MCDSVIIDAPVLSLLETKLHARPQHVGVEHVVRGGVSVRVTTRRSNP
jgi:hypothetical protein